MLSQQTLWGCQDSPVSVVPYTGCQGSHFPSTYFPGIGTVSKVKMLNTFDRNHRIPPKVPYLIKVKQQLANKKLVTARYGWIRYTGRYLSEVDVHVPTVPLAAANIAATLQQHHPTLLSLEANST